MEKGETEFNLSIENAKVIRALFNQCLDARTDLDAYSWYLALNNLFLELSRHMNTQAIEEYKARIRQIRPTINSWSSSYNSTQQTGISNPVFNTLEDLEIDLRMIWEGSGEATKRKSDPSLAMHQNV